MEPTPTGGSAERDPARRDPAERRAEGLDADAVESDGATPRPGLPTLPQRARGPAEPRSARGTDPRTPPGRDPDGRMYGPSDEETLHRLLTGLRDI